MAIEDCTTRGPHGRHPVYVLGENNEGHLCWVRSVCQGYEAPPLGPPLPARPCYVQSESLIPEPYPFGIEPDDSREDFETAGRKLHERIFGTPAPNQS